MERGTSVELAESTTEDPLASSRPAEPSRRIGHASATSSGETIETPCNAGDRKERVSPWPPAYPSKIQAGEWGPQTYAEAAQLCGGHPATYRPEDAPEQGGSPTAHQDDTSAELASDATYQNSPLNQAEDTGE